MWGTIKKLQWAHDRFHKLRRIEHILTYLRILNHISEPRNVTNFLSTLFRNTYLNHYLPEAWVTAVSTVNSLQTVFYPPMKAYSCHLTPFVIVYTYKIYKYSKSKLPWYLSWIVICYFVENIYREENMLFWLSNSSIKTLEFSSLVIMILKSLWPVAGYVDSNKLQVLGLHIKYLIESTTFQKK